MALRRELVSDILWTLFALAIVIGGLVGFRILGALREPLAAAEIERVVPLVETVPLVPYTDPVPIGGEGFVRPRRQVALAAQIGGRVVELHPALIDLGTVTEGEVLVRLDARSARAALTRSESDIDSTRARLELNATQLERAENLRRRGVISQDELDQRLAQEAELTAALSSLESARDSAAIALENTELRAPFDARVLSRSVETGSVVGAGQALAELFTADALEVSVPLSERAASLLPGLFDGGTPTATVTTAFAGRDTVRPARVTRVAGALGADTRMLDVTVGIVPGEVATPDGLPASGLPPALVGAYARVRIDGQVLDDVHALPMSAIRPGGVVWLAVGERFATHPVETVHVDGATGYARLTDLPDGAALIVGVVDTPVEGMRVAPRAAGDDGPVPLEPHQDSSGTMGDGAASGRRDADAAVPVAAAARGGSEAESP